jgi:PKHD-type hydroxylase
VTPSFLGAENMQAQVMRVMSEEDAEQYRLKLADMDWKEGKARTAELTGTVKKNKELKPEDDAYVKHLSNELCQLVTSNRDFATSTMMKQMTAFKFNNYDEPGGTYHRHTDAPWMGKVRTDFTIILALTDPDTYTGGDHHVVSPLEGEMIFRPKAGELMYYETGYPHWVTPVESGSRISALAWLESLVPTERQRALLCTSLEMSRELERKMLDAETDEDRELFRKWFVDAGVLNSGLHRLWANR